jgi:O-antigen/teichoic acid export membrane protein
MLTRLTLTTLTVAVGAAIVPILFQRADWVPAWVAMGYVAASFYGVLAPIGQVIGDSRPYRYATLAQGGVIFGCIISILFVDRNASVTMLVAAYSLGGLVTTMASMWWVRRFVVSLRPRDAIDGVKKNLRGIATLGTATATASVYNRIDQVLLLRLSGGAVAAQYGIAYRVLEQIRVIPSTLQFSLGSFLASRLLRAEGLSELEQRQLRRIGLFGGPGLACLAIAPADFVVLIISGPRYHAAAILAIILAMSLSLAVINYITVTCAIMAHRDVLYLRVALIALVANVVANLLFIPRWGATAAAIITDVTSLLVVAVVSSRLDRRLGAAPFVDIAATLSIGVAAGLIKIWAIHLALGWNLLASAMLAAIGYLGVMHAFRALKTIPHPDEQSSIAPNALTVS